MANVFERNLILTYLVEKMLSRDGPQAIGGDSSQAIERSSTTTAKNVTSPSKVQPGT